MFSDLVHAYAARPRWKRDIVFLPKQNALAAIVGRRVVHRLDAYLCLATGRPSVRASKSTT